jgi:hypothetical protein
MKIFKTTCHLFLIIGILIISSCKKEGCVDNNAINYDSNAKKDDESCRYYTSVEIKSITIESFPLFNSEYIFSNGNFIDTLVSWDYEEQGLDTLPDIYLEFTEDSPEFFGDPVDTLFISDTINNHSGQYKFNTSFTINEDKFTSDFSAILYDVDEFFNSSIGYIFIRPFDYTKDGSSIFEKYPNSLSQTSGSDFLYTVELEWKE